MHSPEPDGPWTRFASAQALEAFGAAVGRRLARGEAVCLFGPLGAGKTTLARGLIRALTHPAQEAPSPSFTLMQTYEGPDFPLAHFDLYRLRGPEEALELGLDEALDEGAAVVEWSERLEGALPPDRLDIVLARPVLASGGGLGAESHEAEGRSARWRGHGGWAEKAMTLEH